MTILLADDDSAFRNLLQEVLSNDGYDVIAVENGQEAMQTLRHPRPDIIVSDIHMPVIDGMQLHKNVRSNPLYTTLPFLFISGYDEYASTSIWDLRYDGFYCKNKPLAEMKDWIQYLTTPLERHDKILPGT